MAKLEQRPRLDVQPFIRCMDREAVVVVGPTNGGALHPIATTSGSTGRRIKGGDPAPAADSGNGVANKDPEQRTYDNNHRGNEPLYFHKRPQKSATRNLAALRRFRNEGSSTPVRFKGDRRVPTIDRLFF